MHKLLDDAMHDQCSLIIFISKKERHVLHGVDGGLEAVARRLCLSVSLDRLTLLLLSSLLLLL